MNKHKLLIKTYSSNSKRRKRRHCKKFLDYRVRLTDPHHLALNLIMEIWFVEEDTDEDVQHKWRNELSSKVDMIIQQKEAERGNHS